MNHDPSIPTSHTLLRRIKDWTDQNSWDEFFKTYSKVIFEFAIKAGLNEAEAQDVVQETITTVATHIHEFQADGSRGSFRSWLLQLARWRVADQLRKRRDDIKASEGNWEEAAVDGGFVHVRDNNVILLSDAAELASQIDVERERRKKEELERRLMDTDDARCEAELRGVHVRIELAGRIAG